MHALGEKACVFGETVRSFSAIRNQEDFLRPCRTSHRLARHSQATGSDSLPSDLWLAVGAAWGYVAIGLMLLPMRQSTALKPSDGRRWAVSSPGGEQPRFRA